MRLPSLWSGLHITTGCSLASLLVSRLITNTQTSDQIERRDTLQFPCSRLFFLRGYPSPSLLCHLGAKYKIDPEFFRRHLDFLQPKGKADDRLHPMLPSSTNDIFQLHITTAGTRVAEDSGRDKRRRIEAMRTRATHSMVEYLH
jgi:hypothetical protein